MIDVQINMFYISVLYGLVMGMTYDFIRIIRRLIRHNNFFIGLEDMAYWTIWAFITIDGIHIYNSGELRSYVFLGVLIGFLIYRYTIGWVVTKILPHILYIRKKRP